MNSCRGLVLLCHKELKDSFRSPLTYVLAALFALLMGWLFFNYLAANKDLTRQTLSGTVLVPLFGNMNFIFLFLAPLLTMRLFAEESKGHTLDLLLRSDLSPIQIILAKYLAVLATTLFLLAFTLVFPVVLSLAGYDDWPVVLASYLGIIFSVMCYLAVGLFASSLTKNQIVAAFGAFCLLLGIMLLVISANATNNTFVAQIFYYISTPSHFESFTRGAAQSYDLVYFASFSGFFLYLTNVSLKARSW